MQGTGKGDACPPCPLFIDFNDQPVTVIGAGCVALRKVESMLGYGARITVIAPNATDGIVALARSEHIRWERRMFRAGDTSGARYVICATDDRDVNRAVYEEAQARGLLVNVVDKPELCNTIVPAVLRRGKLQVAVSTSGAAPSAARKVREELEERYPAYWEPYLDVVAGVRKLIKERVSGPADVRKRFYEALTDGALLGEFAQGLRPGTEDVYERYVDTRRKGAAL